MPRSAPPSSRSILVALAWMVSTPFVHGAEGEGPAAGAGVEGEAWSRGGVDPETLRRVLDEGHVSKRWIYQDVEAGRRRALESGKPLLVVFRCVPCGSAPGLDGPVCTAGGAAASGFEEQIRAAGGDLEDLLDRFVTVRVVKMNGVHRKVFQFDRDLPYVAMFLNAAGAVYGRYGTRSSSDRKKLPRLRLSSFQRSLRRALDLHGDYPRNKIRLEGKRAVAKGAAMPEAMKTFEPFPSRYQPAGVKDCVHCHTVGEAETRQVLAAGRVTMRDIVPFPLPRSVGLDLDVEDGLIVEKVGAASPAAKAGIAPGDELVRLDGQALTSEADVQWALHHGRSEGTIPVVLRRAERTIETELVLAGDWRRGDSHWRASIAPLRPDLHLRPDPYRVKKGAEPGGMGLEIRYPRGASAAAGLRSGDLLVAVDGRTDLHLEADFLRYIHIDRPDVKSVELTIIRKGKRSSIDLPLR